MARSDSALFAPKPFTVQPRSSTEKGTTMNSIRFMAALMVAIFAITVPTRAFAQPAASASGGFDLGVPPEAEMPPESDTATPPTPPTSTPTSPFLFKSESEAVSASYFFMVEAARIGIDWAEKRVDKAIKSAIAKANKGSQPAVTKQLKNVTTGAIRVFENIGKDRMNQDGFTAYLKFEKCEPVMENGKIKMDEAGREIWSVGCKTLADKLSPVILSAIASSSATDPVVKSNAKFTHDQAMSLMKGFDKDPVVRGADGIALLHLAALALPFNEYAQAFGLQRDITVFVGKPACFLYPDGTTKCGHIEAADHTGVTIDGEKIPWDKLLNLDPALQIGDPAKIQKLWANRGNPVSDHSGNGNGGARKPSWSDTNTFSLGVRGFYRWGSADGYTDTSMPGGMVVGQYNVTDYLAVHLGVGAVQLRGTSNIGSEKKDSDKQLAAMAGAVVTGPRNWIVTPVLEFNAVGQGHGLGGEVAGGVEVLPSSSFDLRVLGGYGIYPTGKTPLENKFGRPVETFTQQGGTVIVHLGWTL